MRGAVGISTIATVIGGPARADAKTCSVCFERNTASVLRGSALRELEARSPICLAVYDDEFQELAFPSFVY